jgi:hypothetical protein
MIDGKVHSGTDGSVTTLRSSHSWVLKSTRTGDFIDSHAPTHPTKQVHSTKRPEAAGHAAALIVTRELLRGQLPIAKTMRFHVDNTAVVRGAEAQTHRGPRSTLAPEWDLMKKIHTLKQQIPIRIVTIWVKSHQDDSVPSSRCRLQHNSTARPTPWPQRNTRAHSAAHHTTSTPFPRLKRMSYYLAKWSPPIYKERSLPLVERLNYDRLFLNKQTGTQHGSTG